MDNEIQINGVTLNKTKLLSLIDNGKTIEAIKYIKEETNLGLKDAKEIADTLLENPDFYGGAENTIIEPTIKKRNVIVKNKDRDFKGSHIIKSGKSKKQTFIIFFLLGLIIMLIIFMLQK